jgi:hypothetical protein
MEESANMEIQVMDQSANTECWVMENSADTENRVMQDSRRRKGCCYKEKVSTTVVPKGYYQDTKTPIAKDALKRVGRKRRRRRAGLLV